MSQHINCPSLTEVDRTELIRLRRDFHQHPELAFEEQRTAAVVAERLTELGLEVRTGVGRTGVVGVLRGGAGEGPTLALRADMDALRVTEQAGHPFRSVNEGVMHACGHDGHVATLLTALQLLVRERDQLRGTVLAIFQPAEEAGGGARAMLADGVLDEPRPEVAVGLHYWSSRPTGVIGVKGGPSMASVDEFSIDILGEGGHAAMPHETADALVAAAHVVTALQTVVSRHVDPLQPAVVTVGTFHSGDAFNVISGSARLSGTVRTFDDGTWRKMPELVERVVAATAAAHGCRYELAYDRHIMPLVNDPQVASRVRELAVELVGAERVVEEMTMGGEDMGEFLARVPGCFFFVGAGNEERGITAPHHNPAFDLDEDALAIGTELLVRVTRSYLGV